MWTTRLALFPPLDESIPSTSKSRSSSIIFPLPINHSCLVKVSLNTVGFVFLISVFLVLPFSSVFLLPLSDPPHSVPLCQTFCVMFPSAKLLLLLARSLGSLMFAFALIFSCIYIYRIHIYLRPI